MMTRANWIATLLKWDKESDESLYFITSASRRVSVCLFSGKITQKVLKLF